MNEATGGHPCRELSKAVSAIAAHLSTIRWLVDCTNAPGGGDYDLLRVEQEASGGPIERPANQDDAWLSVFLDLRRVVARAGALWSSVLPNSDATVCDCFTAEGCDDATCGPLTRASYHELILAAGRLVVDRRHPEAVLENELGKIGSMPRDVAPGVARKRMLKALRCRELWSKIGIGLQKEVGRVMKSAKPASSSSLDGQNGYLRGATSWRATWRIGRPWIRWDAQRRLRAHADLLRLASDFEECCSVLRSSPSPHVIEHVRSMMSEAGALLLRALASGIISLPSNPPAWLSWWCSPGKRPRFNGTRTASGVTSRWSWSCGVVGLSYNLDFRVGGSPGHDVRRAQPNGAFLRRQLFIEAACGWLGRQAGSNARVSLPIIRVGLAGPGDASETLGWQEATTDLAESEDGEALLFVHLSRVSEVACRHLAVVVDEAQRVPERRVDDMLEQAGHLERAYCLISDYVSTIDRHQPSDDDVLYREMVEQRIRDWLPKAQPARSPVVDFVLNHLGDANAILGQLGNVGRSDELRKDLERLAKALLRDDEDVETVVRICRHAIATWRGMQPSGSRDASGCRRITSNDQIKERGPLAFWPHDHRDVRSWLGASLALARVCDVAAQVGARRQLGTEGARPLLKLSQALRKHPDWTRIDAAENDIVKVLDEQHRLTEGVDLVLAELGLAVGSDLPIDEVRLETTVGDENHVARDASKPVRPVATLALTGNIWNIGFGESTAQLSHLIGLRYIHALLLQPNRPIHVMMLAHGEPPPDDTPEPLADDQAVTEARHALASLRERIAECDSLDERVDLEAKAKKLDSYLRASTQGQGRRRKPRAARSGVTKCAENVSKAIGRALKKIKAACPPLHEHLLEHIEGRASVRPVYQCPEHEAPTWDLGQPA